MPATVSNRVTCIEREERQTLVIVIVELTPVHAWDYRRYVLQSLPRSFTPARTPANELAYTRKKIESNFSNFSAWHCRTKILSGMWDNMSAEEFEADRDRGKHEPQNYAVSDRGRIRARYTSVMDGPERPIGLAISSLADWQR